MISPTKDIYEVTPKGKNWEKKAQEWMDRLNIFDIAMLNDIVEYKMSQARLEGRREAIEKVKQNIGQLRQWLNENRITDKRMVTNSDIELWVLVSLSQEEEE